MKKVIFAILGLIVLVAIINAVKAKPAQPTTTAEKAVATETVTPETKPSAETKKSNWAYDERTDKMDGTVTKFASVTSTNEVEFDFPYGGGSTFQVIVRKGGKQSEMMFSVSKGQIIGSIMDEKKMRLKFDNEAPISVAYNSPSDGTSNLVFLNQAARLIQKLKTAKKLMVEAEFFQAGYKQAEFDVSGLEW